MIIDINNEDRLVQTTFAEHLENELGWENVYALNQETFGPDGTLGRADAREVVLKRDLRSAIARLNPELPEKAVEEAVTKLTYHDFPRSLHQHNQAFYKMIRDGVSVSYRETNGTLRHAQAKVIDFRNGTTNGQPNNRFVAVRELKITGLRAPNYNRRADLVCFVNGLPLVFIELKAVYRNIRGGFDGNLQDYLDEHVIAHAFHHNAFLIVSNGHRARYGSITSQWEHFGEWKRLDERDKGNVDAEVLLNGMLAKERLLDIVENFILFDASKPGATRKVVARNHQVMVVNNAVAAAIRQEELKLQISPEERLKYRLIELPWEKATDEGMKALVAADAPRTLLLPEAAHPDLGKLGVFWHTQGSGKSHSMAFFAEKVWRTVPGNFTFVLMTDRNDLDSQIYRTFVGCGLADANTPRAGSGKELEQLLQDQRDKLKAQAVWLESTIIEIIISEAQGEVAAFKEWKFNIIPHRATMKLGFETDDGKRVDVESAFKNPEHPFRIAIVCAMWLTGFDVECLSTLYIDKPMKAHTLMQAIARANRRYPGKDFGLIVDYNGMLKSLREALAQYALGDGEGGGEEIVAPIEERVKALLPSPPFTAAEKQLAAHQVYSYVWNTSSNWAGMSARV